MTIQLYIRGISDSDSGGTTRMEWFRVSVAEDEADKNWRRRIPGALHCCMDMTQSPIIKPYLKCDDFYILPPWEILGSFTYLIGSPRNQYCDETGEFMVLSPLVYRWYWDNSMTLPNFHGPTMNSSRSQPLSVVVGNMLFVFGGLGYYPEPEVSWAEFLDLNANRWECLPCPNQMPILTNYQPHAVVESLNQIIICMRNEILRFDFSSWECTEQGNFNQFRLLNGRGQVAQHTIFWFCLEKWAIVGYNVKEKIWLRGVVRGLEEEKIRNQEDGNARLAILDENNLLFCLIWTSPIKLCKIDFDPFFDADFDHVYENESDDDDGDHFDDDRIVLRLAKIRINRTTAGDRCNRFDAECISYRSYIVDHNIRIDSIILRRRLVSEV